MEWQLAEDQLTGRDFLADRYKALLADEVGYGKTVQALAAVSMLGLRDVLYVTGAQPAYDVVNDNVPKFAPNHTARVVRGSKRQRQVMWHDRSDISVVGYETFRNDWRILAKIPWDLIILDDASKFKNPESHLSKAAHRVTRGKRAWAMTATPIENELIDLWAIFHAIDYHPLGTWPTFNARYLVWGWKKHQNGRHTKDVIRYEHLDELKEKLRGNVLRRTGVSGPRLMLATHYLGVYPEQARLYRLARSGHFGNTIHDRFTRCLMFLDSTRFADQHPGVSSKIDLIAEILDHFEGKVVIYSQWKVALRHLKDVLVDHDINFVEISGDVPIPLRHGITKRFNEDPSIKVCLLTRAGEQALNLPAAQLLITINRIANPQRMYQVHGRIKRRTSPFDKIYILDLVIRDTIEERMIHLSERRRELPRTVFGDDIPERFTTEDMGALLREDMSHTPEEIETIEL